MRYTGNQHNDLILAARRMRANPMPAESLMWNGLRDRKLSNLKFHRQKVIGPIVVDFYCAAARLIVEIDGEIHDYQFNYDKERTIQLSKRGYRVIRFSNKMVLNDIDRVLQLINSVATEQISEHRRNYGCRVPALTPSPSPDSGRGEETHEHSNVGESTLTPCPSPDSGRGESPQPVESQKQVGDEVINGIADESTLAPSPSPDSGRGEKTHEHSRVGAATLTPSLSPDSGRGEKTHEHSSVDLSTLTPCPSPDSGRGDSPHPVESQKQVGDEVINGIADESALTPNPSLDPEGGEKTHEHSSVGAATLAPHP